MLSINMQSPTCRCFSSCSSSFPSCLWIPIFCSVFWDSFFRSMHTTAAYASSIRSISAFRSVSEPGAFFFYYCNSSEVHSNSERKILQLVLRLPPKTVTEVLFNLASGVHSKDFSLRFGAALGVFSTEEELLKAHHALMFMYSSNSLEVHCANKKWDGMMIDQGGHYIKHKDIYVYLNRYKKHLFCFCGGRWCTMFTCWACCSNCIDGIPVPSTLIAGWKICHLHSIYQEWWELFQDGKVWISLLCCLSVWWRIMGFPEHMIQMMGSFNRWFQKKSNMFQSTLDHWHSMSTSFFSVFS